MEEHRDQMGEDPAGINECEEERKLSLPGLMCVPEAGTERGPQEEFLSGQAQLKMRD